MISPDERQMLQQAIERSEKLLADLVAQQEELDRSPPKIAREDLVAGRAAMQNAIAAAGRTVKALRDARQAADDDEDPENGRSLTSDA